MKENKPTRDDQPLSPNKKKKKKSSQKEEEKNIKLWKSNDSLLSFPFS